MSVTRLLVPLLAAGLVAGSVVAVSAGGQGAGPPTGTLALDVVTKSKNGTYVDVPPKSKKFFSDGDKFVGRGTVSGGAQGTVAYEFTYDGKSTFLRGALSLAGGKLFFEEFDKSGTKLTRGAIVGGTGSYAGARGDFEDRTVKDTSTTTTSRVTITFVG
jgi:hypothetical protein